MTITLFVSRGHGRASQQADHVVAFLNELGGPKRDELAVEIVDTTSDTEARRRAKDAGLMEVAFEQSGNSIQRGYLGAVFAYREARDVIPVFDLTRPSAHLFWVATKLREVRDVGEGANPIIGAVSGKAEVRLDEPNLVPPVGGQPGPSMASIMRQALPYFRFADVDLKDEINPDLAGLLITQVGVDFDDDELRRIDRFVMRGRSLVVLASAVDVPAWDPSMTAKLDRHRLDRLLDGYGVEMISALALDPTHSYRIAVESNRGPQSLAFPSLLLVAPDDALQPAEQTLDAKFGAFIGLTQLAMPYASPLRAHPKRQPEAKLSVVARTSREAEVVSASPIDLRPDAAVRGKPAAGPVDLAIAVEGEIRSAFGDQRASEARILVLSSAHFLANPFARAGNPAPGSPGAGDPMLQKLATAYAHHHVTQTTLAFKSLLDWALADARIAPCAALLSSEE